MTRPLCEEDSVLDMIEGAVIVSASVDVAGRGVHLNLADGRVLIFEGAMTVGLYRSMDKLH